MSLPETAYTTDDPAKLIPLTFNQDFLCAFDRGDMEGAFGQRHTLVNGWRLRGRVDIEALWGALDDVVCRHETLRTTIVRGEGPRYQIIHPPKTPELRLRDLSTVDLTLRDLRAEELLNEIDAEPLNVRDLPHLRATLARFDGADGVLVLATHHTATDGWSMHLLIRDLISSYAARCGQPVPTLPRVHQYREFAIEQQADRGARGSRAYWRGKLRDARIVPIRPDTPQPAHAPTHYAVHRFLFDAPLTSAVQRLATLARSSPFMVLVAAYNVLLCRLTGVHDLVVPTFTSGRYADRFLDTVGPFFNFLPLRTDLDGCESFRDAVSRTRATCLEAYAHDIPFQFIVEEAPGLPAAFADDGAVVAAFEILQSPTSTYAELACDLTCTEIRRRVVSQPLCSDIPNGVLWAIDILPSGEMAGSLKYDSNRFAHGTAAALVADYRRLLSNAVAAPDSPLKLI